MLCRDTYLSYLKDLGYNVIRLPKSDFPPLMLLAHEGQSDLNRIGTLADLLEGDAPPLIQKDVRAAGISGKKTSSLNPSFGLNLLGSIIGAMGGGQVGLEAQFGKTSAVTFVFPEVFSDRIDPIQLDKYLARAKVSPDTKYFADVLNADDVYVVTDVIKSRKFTVDASSDKSAGVALNIPALQELVGAKVKVSGESNKTNSVTFEGDTPLVFGFQARRLMYDGGNYLKIEPVSAGSVVSRGATRSASSKVESNMLVTRGAWTNVK